VWPKGNKGYQWKSGQDMSGVLKGKLSRLVVSSDGKFIAVVEARE